MTERVRCLNKTELDIVKPVIQRGAYAAHSENMLVAMLADEEEKVRCDAIGQILKIREKSTANKLRTFEVPTINFNAQRY